MKIITGMHRSGTSLTARLFYEAGADLGNPTGFYPPDRWNPDGYYEQRDIHAVNMPLINGPLGKLAYFALPSTNTIRQRAIRRRTQIHATAVRYQDRIVKDCRYCLTLPAWLDQSARVDRILVCLREPWAVARSLQRRNQATNRHGLRLWKIHYDRLLANKSGVPLWFVHYDNLLDETRFAAEIRPAFAFFDIAVADATLQSLQRRCVNPSPRSSSPTHADYPKEIMACWQRLQDQHSRQLPL